MPAVSTDRNLLFGFLALQNDFIAREELIAAVSVWLTDKSRSLDDILRERRALADDERQVLSALVEKHLARHGGDTEKSLAAVSTVSMVRDELHRLEDTDIEATLSHVPARPPTGDPQFADTLSVDPAAALACLNPTPSGETRFHIMRPHAKGGLGQVFVAKDLELNRDVALKEIQLHHADDPDSRARFVLEAEVTGGLEHPGIVPVYGLGQYSDGRPYYAMRFIRGDSLKEAIERFHHVGRTSRSAEENKLVPAYDSVEFRKLLNRFIDVCNAIEYAHSRGVLHRDLKPGNIMLGKYGETLVVDWGLAKVKCRAEQHQASDEETLQPRSNSGSAVTEMNRAIGTPAYMSPEQAAGRLNELGPASDVYSLGATLYSVLTGQLPFAKASPADILTRVQTGDFIRPRQVCPSIPKPLEAICLKAMALRAADRYASPQSLADDIERYQADEAVQAHAEPVTLRARRWLRKHPRSVAAVAATLLVGLSSTIVIAAVVSTKNKQLAQSNHELTEREAETSAVLNFVENKIFAAARPEGQDGGLGHEVTLRRAVESALPFVAENFRGQPLIEARLRTTLGNSFAYLGQAKIAAQQHEVARAIYHEHRGADHPNTLRSMNNVASSYAALGRDGEALDLHKKTLELTKAKFGPDHPDTLMSMSNLAISYSDLGRHADALKLHEETLALLRAKLGADHRETLFSMHNVASGYTALGRYAESLKLLEETVAQMKAKLGPDHPDTLMSMESLAVSYFHLGRHAEALALRETTVALKRAKLGAEHPETLKSTNNLANSYAVFGRHADAVRLYETSLALTKAKLGADHPETLASMNNLASIYAALGRDAEALKLLEEARALMTAKLGADHPNTLQSMNNLGSSYASLGRYTEALTIFEETCALMKGKLGPDHPDTLRSMYNLAKCYTLLGRQVEALELYEETVALRKAKLGTDHPDTLTTMNNLANSYAGLGRQAEAIKLREEMLTVMRAKLGPDHSETLFTANSIAWLRATSPDEQIRNGQQAIALAAEVCKLTGWKNPMYLLTLAAAHAEAGDFGKAIEWQEKTIAIGIPGVDDSLRIVLELYKSGKPYRQPPPKPAAPAADAPPP